MSSMEKIQKVLSGESQGCIVCADHLEVIKYIPDSCIDLTVTSPPYGSLRDYKGYTFNFEILAGELFRITKKGGVLVWIVGDQVIDGSESGESFRQALYFKEVGFNLHDTMIYARHSRFVETTRYSQFFEYMFILSKDKPKIFNPLQRENISALKRSISGHREKDGSKTGEVHYRNEFSNDINIWLIHPGGSTSGDKAAFDHPAIFPEDLAKDHIISWSNPNDIVFDPMVGSGTTCKMAKLLGRRYIGIDISADYCRLSEERLKAIDTGIPVKESRKGQLGLFHVEQ